ncbi:MAG TPA: hypothetical protein VFZ74_00510 [Burkholderiales bacterium]
MKNTYGGAGGFLGGQVFRFSGFVSQEGSLGGVQAADGHVWQGAAEAPKHA